MPISDFINKETSSIEDGCCVIDKKHGINIVLYNAFDKNWERRNWSIAHEIGHIYLNHTKDGPIEEIEAHYFASQLFMPEFTLFMIEKTYGSFNADDLREIFDVSRQAAEKRLITFNRKTIISGGPEATAIWERQKPKIDLYYQCKKNNEDFRFFLEVENHHKRNAEYYEGFYSSI